MLLKKGAIRKNKYNKSKIKEDSPLLSQSSIQ